MYIYKCISVSYFEDLIPHELIIITNLFVILKLLLIITINNKFDIIIVFDSNYTNELNHFYKYVLENWPKVKITMFILLPTMS